MYNGYMSPKYDLQTLKSGLTLVSVPMQTESIAVLAVVHAGSRDESLGQFGAAHFLEHFVFKGTRAFPKVNDVTKEIDEVGGEQNAFTSHDYTGFWVKVANSHWRKAVTVVSQLVCEPILPEGELAGEKGAIIEEINMYEDSHPSKAWNVFDQMLFGETGLGRPVLGSKESITAMRVEDLKAFRTRWYDPKNMIVVVVGSLPKGEVLVKEVVDKFGSLSSKEKETKREGHDLTFEQDRPRVTVTNKKTEQAHLILGGRGISANDPRLYALAVMNNILGGNMSSRLWDEVREKRGLAYYIRSIYDTHFDQGVIGVRAGVRLADFSEAVKVIVEELGRISSTRVSSDELKRGKEGVKGSLKLELEDTQAVADLVAADWALMGGRVRTLESILDAIDQVEAQDIQALAFEFFRPQNLNLSVVGPFDKKDKEKVEKILKMSSC